MKTILVTGATDGIGQEVAKGLASNDHHVLLHGRNAQKLAQTVSLIKEANPDLLIASYQADLSDMAQVKQLVMDLKHAHPSLDVIINNAGVFKTNSPVTSEGVDARFSVNTIAPYLITKALLPLLTADGRVVNISSAAQAPVNIDALLGKVKLKDDFQAYAQSKLALTIWSQELATRIKPTQVMVAVNPGSLLATKMVKEGFGLPGNDLRIGADIVIQAATSSAFENASGKYYDNDAKKFSAPHLDAQNKEVCAELMSQLDALHKLYF